MPGPSTPGQAAQTQKQLAGPKISGAEPSYVGLHPTGDTATANAVIDSVEQGWRTLATAIGETAPGHVNRTRRAITALKRYGG